MNTHPLRIGFMGTPDFAQAGLAALCATEHELVCVYTQPPRPKGRGQAVQKSPVHLFADARGLPVYTPRTLKDKAVQDEFAAHRLDVAIVAAYGLMLPDSILSAPVHGCVNVHASLLPRWRGASPIQHAIWKGDTESGIALMQMDSGLDTGPVIDMQAVPITPHTTSAALHDALCELQAVMLPRFCDDMAACGRIDSTPQDHDLATYAPRLRKEDGRVLWSDEAMDIDRQVRALNPWPGVWTFIGDKRLKILAAESVGAYDGEPAQPGTVVDKTGVIACGGNTAIRLITVQPPGKKSMDFVSALNGGYISVGDVLT